MVRLSGKDINDLGNYKACNELDGAKYVLVSTWVFFELAVGLCIPKSCNKDDLELLKDTMTGDLFNFDSDKGERRRLLESRLTRLPGLLSGRRMQDKDDEKKDEDKMPPVWFTFPEEEFDDELSLGGVLMILIILAIGAVSMAATIYDVCNTYKNT